MNRQSLIDKRRAKLRQIAAHIETMIEDDCPLITEIMDDFEGVLSVTITILENEKKISPNAELLPGGRRSAAIRFLQALRGGICK